MRSRRVWIVSHVEVVLLPRSCVVDAMILFVGSSRGSAMRFIRLSHVDAGSWWKIEVLRTDDPEGRQSGDVLYDRKGALLKRAPVRAGYRAALARLRRNEAKLTRELRRHVRPPPILKRTLSSLRRCLKGHPLKNP